MISIIIPTRNEAKVISDMVQQLRRQLTSLPYEIIVSDNHSTDDTVALARAHADHVVVSPDPEPGTIAATRNRGAALARYPYLVFLDGGVRVPSPNEFFSKLLSSFEQDQRLVGQSVNIRVYPESATFADSFFFTLTDWWLWLANNVLQQGWAQGKFQMITTAAFRQLGGYNPALVVTEDNELFKRLRGIGRTRFEPGLTVYHGGRRAHALGWPRLLLSWWVNALPVMTGKKAVDKEWKVIR